ncbi:inositol monophosphatase [Plantactinospora sp. S1510]|uniref:Inositol-1-monophosphatase n=1 Tax=Plantactinospora alkalitolerans TaxID=2789879 RepID=A0ABS0GX60_9ACTN|nr:inositol monophosphatase family protein [Plantactinospora alkalitolerans]MBF9130798.1 inositol monophosphatase [Plantactinospora alkalitolerans]
MSVLPFAVDVAHRAGAILAELRGRVDVEYKNGVEPVTEADLRSDALIREAVAATYPDHRVLSEEGAGPADLAGPVWVVDPIDGTANYARGHPYVAVSIAYAVDGVVRAGVVHAPFLHETFTATRGSGARLNGVPIRPSDPPDLRRAIVSTGFPHYKADLDPLVERVRRLLAGCQDIRRASCPSLDICYVAAGRLDAHTESLAPWDVAAAGLVAVEAGAVRSHLEPDDFPPDLAGNGFLVAAPAIHGPLVRLLGGPPRTRAPG